ncbi:hypothetical protein ABXS75_11410 [Roseburia hominis]
MLKESYRTQLLCGSLQDYKQHMSGIYRGYPIVIDLVNGQYAVKINAQSVNDPGNAGLNAFLRQQKENIKQIAQVNTYDHCAVLTIQVPGLAKNIPNTVNAIIDPVIGYMINYGYGVGCEQCGNTSEELYCYEINSGHHYLCSNCSASIENSLQAHQQDVLSAKSNLVPGLVGALLGSLIGCALWIVIYKLGYIAGIAGAVTAICAMKGYELLGGCLDRKGVIGSVIIMLVIIYIGNKVAWSWEAYDALKEYGYTFSDCFRGLGEILKASDLVGGYCTDLVIGYGLTLVCSYKNIINAFRASKGSYKISKMN